jgi:hypothetical protein
VAHRSEEPSVRPSTHVANDRSSFASPESDCTSNVTHVARKQHVDRHWIIHAEQSSRFEPIPRQNLWMQNNMCDTQWSEFIKFELLYIFYNWTCGLKSEEPSVGSGTHVANDRSSFTSSEFDYTSNVTHVARKQRVDRHRIIHAERSSRFEPIPRQNFCDGG